MTNKEKALEIFPDMPTLIPLCIGVREKLVEMANWKDQQFKEFLEKKKEQFYYQPKDLMGGWEKKHKLEILEEIINELFSKIENDNSENDE